MKKSYKIRKLERNRKSILTDDIEHCLICKRYGVELHEVFFGKNRQNSMKYGCVAPLCHEHHTGISGVHNNQNLDLKLKKMCQRRFLKFYICEVDEFVKIFKKNYC